LLLLVVAVVAAVDIREMIVLEVLAEVEAQVHLLQDK
jgi:hypothetical protein